jgi:PEP-CTERM motif
MIRTIRSAAFVAAALVSAVSANAAVYQTEFKTFYDPSTWYNPTDKAVFDTSVASLKVEDIAGGAKLTLSFIDTNFPSTSKGLYIDQLMLSGTQSATISKVSGDTFSGKQYRSGFYTPELDRRNWDVNYTDGAFKEGETSSFTIKGNGVTAASLLAAAPVLELANVGAPYNAPFGLNKTVRFIGSAVLLPEPSTYALMGLGLVGIAFVARKRKAA